MMVANREAKETNDLVESVTNIIVNLHLRRFYEDLLVRYGENYSERAFGDKSGLVDCLEPIFVHRP